MKPGYPAVIAAVVGICVAVPLHAEPVWIDTDPACGISMTTDVDDCWALQLAIRSPRLEVRGIGTVFGNSDGRSTYRKAREAVRRITGRPDAVAIHRGSDTALDPQRPQLSDAGRALARQLETEALTILALGPVTNIAAILIARPELAGRIRKIIVVAGRRAHSGSRFYPGKSAVMHLHDFNFRQDVAAFEVLLRASVPLTMIPYEAASKIVIGPGQLGGLAASEQTRWLARASREWLAFWRIGFGAGGFFPFDSLAVAYAIDPAAFTCRLLPVAIERRHSLFVESRDDLVVGGEAAGSRKAEYCYDVGGGIETYLGGLRPAK